MEKFNWELLEGATFPRAEQDRMALACSWSTRLMDRPQSFFSSFLFPFIFISWRLTTLQYCSGFCHALTWIGHGFTRIPHPDPPSRLRLLRTPCVALSLFNNCQGRAHISACPVCLNPRWVHTWSRNNPPPLWRPRYCVFQEEIAVPKLIEVCSGGLWEQ